MIRTPRAAQCLSLRLTSVVQAEKILDAGFAAAYRLNPDDGARLDKVLRLEEDYQRTARWAAIVPYFPLDVIIAKRYYGVR